jgi:hypothetical protein
MEKTFIILWKRFRPISFVCDFYKKFSTEISIEFCVFIEFLKNKIRLILALCVFELNFASTGVLL